MLAGGRGRNSVLSSRLDYLRLTMKDAFEPSWAVPPDRPGRFTLADVQNVARYAHLGRNQLDLSGNDLDGLLGLQADLAQIPASSDQELADSIRDYGFEAVAFYHSFHRDDDSLATWGIYLIGDRIKALVTRLERSLRSRPKAENIVYECIDRHERFHLRLDLFALMVEEQRAEGLGRKAAYLPYSSNVYVRTRGTRECLEEALAQAEALKPLKGRARQVMLAHSRRMPPGYAQFGDHLRDSIPGTDQLLGQVIEAKANASAYPYRLPSVSSVLRPNDVPVHVVLSKDLGGKLRPIAPLASPPLRQAMRVLKPRGVSMVMLGGSHHVKFKIGKKLLPHSANYRDGRLPHYLLADIARELGEDPRDLEQEIRAGRRRHVARSRSV